MPNWNKQTHLLRNAESLDDRIEILRTWVADLKLSKLKYFLQSSFRTLNSLNRYKYYMDETTVTHEKYLTFLVCLEFMCKMHNNTDWADIAMNELDMKSSKSYITLYFIMKLYLMKDELQEIKLRVSDSEVVSLLEYAKTGGHEFKDIDYYDYMDQVRSILKDYKRRRHNKDKVHGKMSYSDLLRENEILKEELKQKKKAKKKKHDWSNMGDIVNDIYSRRTYDVDNTPVKVKSKKKGKKKVKLMKGAW